MYSRQNDRRERTFSVPQNYSGNAFNDISEHRSVDGGDVSSEIDESKPEVNADTIAEASPTSKNFLPISISSEELIIIGLALLLFQSNKDDGIIPLLLAILFLG